MGNQCSDSQSTKITDSQFGDINQTFNTGENTYETVFYNFESFKELEIERVKNHWEAIKELPSEHIVKPHAIREEKDKVLFIPRYSLTIDFTKYDRNIQDYANDFLKRNPLIPEITVINVMSDIVDAMHALFREGIRHENISPQTIFIDYNNKWILATPNYKTVNLTSRTGEPDTPVKYLIAAEVANSKFYDPFVADVYSFGITLLQILTPLSPESQNRYLEQRDVDRLIEAVRPYYSSHLMKLLTAMSYVEKGRRSHILEIMKMINALRDVQA
jgi:hypothetical protein